MAQRKIILASRSEARKRLLQTLGLTFTVIVPHVRERRRGSSYRSLVVENARRKAQSVVRGVRDEVIISADTLVVSGKKIIGKPKTPHGAEKMLTLLCSAPCRVYSGIVLLDSLNGKVLTGWEKTKVYMSSLTDAQIKRYIRRTAPFDKAGGFDIGGPAAAFIDRIEGCYSNVVGLPLAHLSRLLRQAGLEIF